MNCIVSTKYRMEKSKNTTGTEDDVPMGIFIDDTHEELTHTEDQLFMEFIKETDNQIARAMGVPMEFLRGDKENSIEYYKEVTFEKSKRENPSREEDNN